MTLTVKLLLIATLILSIIIPFGYYLLGEQSKKRYKKAIGANVFFFFGAFVIAGIMLFGGDTVHAAEAATQTASNATGFGYPKGQIPQMKEFSFQADEYLRKIAHDVCEEVNPEIRVFEGRIASGDQFVCDQGVKDNIVKEFSAYAVEMEGAAIGQAAALNGIPFLIIRAISDKADNSANMDYPAFEKLAIEHSVRLTQGMLKRMV